MKIAIVAGAVSRRGVSYEMYHVSSRLLFFVFPLAYFFGVDLYFFSSEIEL
jgi:hypothetical protein